MKIELLSGAPLPPAQALIVCAGTVTCRNVAEMGSGFTKFKEYFDQNQSSKPGSKQGWQEDLDQTLIRYQYQRALPLYCRIAQQGTYLGGVATVACLGEHRHITPTHQNLPQADLEEQYKAAVRLAVEDAIKLNRPLYIQPLGIGVYGWDSVLAATLFGEVLAEFQDTAGEVYIPIYNQVEGSNDLRFAAQLQSEITKGLRPRVRNTPNSAAAISADQTNHDANLTRALHRRSILLKCLAILLSILSAAFILMAIFALLSITATTPVTTAILGATGVAFGIQSYFMFRSAKLARDIAENVLSPSAT